MMLRHYIKQFSDFSSSPIKPLIWMLIGPLLILFTLLISLPTCSDAFLSFGSTFGLLFIWKWGLRGLSFTLLAFTLYFCTQFFFLTNGVSVWQCGWGASFSLALIISYLSMEELKHYYQCLKKDGEELITELKEALHHVKTSAESEKRQMHSMVDQLKQEQSVFHKEKKTLLQLVQASRLEVEKFEQQNTCLSKESLKQHRQIETLKLQIQACKEEIKTLQEQNFHLIEHNAVRLKKLNILRTEYLQMTLLFEAAQKDFQKFRALILIQREQLEVRKVETFLPEGAKPVVPQEVTPFKSRIDRGQHLVLKTLEKDKTTIKEVYDQIQKDYEKLIYMLKEAEANHEEEAFQTLKKQTIDKKKKLEQTKSELVSLEREIFVIKKGMQQQGLEVLGITD